MHVNEQHIGTMDKKTCLKISQIAFVLIIVIAVVVSGTVLVCRMMKVNEWKAEIASEIGPFCWDGSETCPYEHDSATSFPSTEQLNSFKKGKDYSLIEIRLGCLSWFTDFCDVTSWQLKFLGGDIVPENLDGDTQAYSAGDWVKKIVVDPCKSIKYISLLGTCGLRLMDSNK